MRTCVGEESSFSEEGGQSGVGFPEEGSSRGRKRRRFDGTTRIIVIVGLLRFVLAAAAY